MALGNRGPGLRGLGGTEDLGHKRTQGTEDLRAQKIQERLLSQMPRCLWRKILSRSKDDMANLRHGPKVGEGSVTFPHSGPYQ